MKKALLCLVIVVAVLIGGCSKNGISVNVTDEGRDVYQDPEGSRDGAVMRVPDEEAGPGRAPFIDLSSYEWDYMLWLERLTDSVAPLRLPGSKAAFVELRFAAGGAMPEVRIECGDVPDDCDSMRLQVSALAGFPRLPESFPHGELVVKLSRLP